MRVGNRTVVGGGSIVTQQGDDTVELNYGVLALKLVFEKADGDPSVVTGITGQLLSLRLLNFDNPFGITWASQVGLSPDGARKLHLAIHVQTIGAADSSKVTRLINYTFSEDGG